MKILSIKNLTVSVNGTLIVDKAALDIGQGSIVGLVGGSGSGKTTTGLAVLGLLHPRLVIEQGEVMFLGEDLRQLTKERMRAVRAKGIGMIFQDPLSAFNPVLTIGSQISEVLAVHAPCPLAQRLSKVLEVLRSVGIEDPSRIYHSYPHQLSGGLRQRAMIAQAIVCEPHLIIADEPTSNLDVTVAVKIMDLLLRLKKELNISILLITHDLGMVSHMADHVHVMNKGIIVESGSTQQVIHKPMHAYTKALLAAF